MAERNGLPSAARINCGVCLVCDHIHLDLIDAEGNPYATAALGADIVEPLIAKLRALQVQIAARPKAGHG